MLSISPLRAAIFLSAVHMAVWQSDLKGLVAIAIKTPGLPDLHWCCPRCSDLHPVVSLLYSRNPRDRGRWRPKLSSPSDQRSPLQSMMSWRGIISFPLPADFFSSVLSFIGYGGRGGVVFLSGKVNLIYCVPSNVLVLLFFKNIWLEHIMIYTVACVPLDNIVYCCPF